MRFSRPSTRSHRSQTQILGVVLLLLMYMAQPVLALQSALCGCSGMMSSRVCACSSDDLGPAAPVESSSCCAQKRQESQAQSCCASGEDSGSESVCHCPVQPTDPVPTGMVFDGQACTGPFVWWAEMEAQATESHDLAPHLGGSDSVETDRSLLRSAHAGEVPDGLDRGPTGPVARRMRAGGLTAFLADLSVANL